MKQIQFDSLPKLIAIGHLNFDGNLAYLRLDSEESFWWGGKTKKEYAAACRAIDNIQYKGEGWKLYAWCDISSYEYWMKKQQEQNYIQITVTFDNLTVNESEIPNIVKALDKTLALADAIQNKYSFNPSIY